MKHYTEILRGLREDRDLKQVEIANIIGTSQQHYSKYETGEYELPLRVLLILADYYNVSADYIIGRTKCKEGVGSLNKEIVDNYTAGSIISDILSLPTESRAFLVEFISLLKIKEGITKKSGKNRLRK